MTRHDEQFSGNSSQVWDAERRLAVQQIFIGRLHVSGNDTRSADETLEVMRDILRELYCARSLLRRKGVPRNGAPEAPLCIRMARAGASGRSRAGASGQFVAVADYGRPWFVAFVGSASALIRNHGAQFVHQGIGPPSQTKSRPEGAGH